jgi:hypothetical protein
MINARPLDANTSMRNGHLIQLITALTAQMEMILVVMEWELFLAFAVVTISKLQWQLPASKENVKPVLINSTQNFIAIPLTLGKQVILHKFVLAWMMGEGECLVK